MESWLTEAQFNFGMMLAKGDGVPKNNVNACLWWNLAEASGNQAAAENRAILEKQMTPEEIAEAKRLAAQFVPRSAPTDSPR
jgi:TPR repeat protein